MDIVYTQPLKELLAVSTYFKEQLVVLVTTEKDEKVAKTNGLFPCYLINDKSTESEIQKLKSKTIAVLGGSVKANELAIKLKANYLLQPSDTKQYFDLGLAQKLSDNGTIVALMFGDLLKANSFERHQYWKNYIELVRYCKQKKVKFIVASGTKDPLLLRPKKVRETLAVLLGLPRELATRYLEEEIK
jgi:RNase P/RNase MRP subunit p30